jgi:hypothetical protein
MQEKINEAIQVFQRMDGIEQAGFTFWSICVLIFYGTLAYILFLGGKDLFTSLTKRIKLKH